MAYYSPVSSEVLIPEKPDTGRLVMLCGRATVRVSRTPMADMPLTSYCLFLEDDACGLDLHADILTCLCDYCMIY